MSKSIYAICSGKLPLVYPCFQSEFRLSYKSSVTSLFCLKVINSYLSLVLKDYLLQQKALAVYFECHRF